MSEKFIKQLIKTGEKIDVELKLAQGGIPSNLFATVCAFSNRFGGHIILGVEEKTKKIVGFTENNIIAPLICHNKYNVTGYAIMEKAY